jgi:hypothetical protein
MATSKRKQIKTKSKGEAAQARRDESSELGDNIRLDDAQGLFVKAGTVGAIFWALSVFWGLNSDETKQFMHSYLVAFMWTLTIALGGLFWVTLQHLVNANWSIVVRRIGEMIAGNMTLLAVLALPIVLPTLFGNSGLYLWADKDAVHADHLLHHKEPYLNLPFFAIRFILYFAFWAALGRYFLVHSLRQDQSGDPKHAERMARVSAPCMIVFALTLTFAAFDFLMSLDPYWFSTIFGVYIFAGSVISIHATLALTLVYLQAKGRLTRLVGTEHFHDIGKMMFAFTVFWAYIGFSQFMLIWYANIPEETAWYHARFDGGWRTISWLLVFGHFVVPFFGLLSRHIKRNKKTLAFWAAWMLIIHYVDMYWLVMPNLHAGGPSIHWLDVTCFIGMLGLFIAGVAFQARGVNLVPTKDPRLAKSLAFENI